MFTTEPSRRAMLDPTMVAPSVSHLRLCDRAASKAGVASMTPASQGDRINPTIGCSKNGYRRFEVHLAYIADNLSLRPPYSASKCLQRAMLPNQHMAYARFRCFGLMPIEVQHNLGTLFG